VARRETMEKLWLTIKDLSDYLQIPETKIHHIVKQGAIPFSDKLGSARFFKPEIDEWMKTPWELSLSGADEAFLYRGKPILEYTLAARKILIGKPTWKRLLDFVQKMVKAVDEIDRSYLYRKEFESFTDNYDDYLNLSYWLGLIDKEKQGRTGLYYPTEYSRRISVENDLESMKKIILESILNIVGNRLEELPDERHALFLLWYFMKLRASGETPAESHFSRGAETTAYPSIRLNFSKGFCNFLFGKDSSREQEFFEKWDKYVI